MTTRSGKSYQHRETDGRRMSLEEGGSEATGGFGDMLKLLVEDRRQREEEYAAERARREAETERRTEEMARQVELLTRLVGERGRPAGAASVKLLRSQTRRTGS